MKDKEEGCNADYLSIETYRAEKKKEISQICQSTVFAGTDIDISSGKEHFSLKDEDQLNLFGKQAQLTAGIKKLEYHEDGNPCRYYSAEDMQKIINGAMEFKSYHTTIEFTEHVDQRLLKLRKSPRLNTEHRSRKNISPKF